MSRICILMYHALFETDQQLNQLPQEDRAFAVHVSEFERQIDALLERGVKLMSPVDELNVTLAGQEPIRVLLTFDDGHRSVYEYAAPRLRRLGTGGIVFATTDFISQRRGFCSWKELLELSESGFVIGAHGKTHRFLSELSTTDLVEELRQPRRRLEEALGTEVRRLALPGGRFNAHVMDHALEAGYRRVYGSQFGRNSPQADWQHMPLRRIAVKRSTGAEHLCAMVEGRFPRYTLVMGAELAKSGLQRSLGDRRYHQLYQLYRHAKP